MVRAPTPKDLVLALAKREGLDRNAFPTFLALQRDIATRWIFTTDHRRNCYTATRRI